jgi:uncharacterized membrane protein YccF (DUF307 family)
MGCLMNVLWLVFGGILTAVEYMIASLLMMITISPFFAFKNAS